jgi:crotonobetainyl-CoA:carnitine CoA-transferase CaiB-like acyl-CoA transferase
VWQDQLLERWCVISVANDDEWRALCGVLDRAALADDPRFATMEARRENVEDIDALLGAWTQELSPEEVMLTLQAAGVAAGAVHNGRDMFEDPQMQARGHYHRLVHTEAGPARYDGLPFTLSDTPVEVRPAPMLGEHNEYVFGHLLGLSEDEISEGYAEGYIA